MKRLVRALAFTAVLAAPAVAPANSLGGDFGGALRLSWALSATDFRSEGGADSATVSVDSTEAPDVRVVLGEQDVIALRVDGAPDDKKAKFADFPGGVASAQDLMDLVVTLASPAKKDTIAPPVATITSARHKGKVRGKKTGLRLKLRLKLEVEGAVAAGPHQGETFKGRIKVKFDGDRILF